MYAQCALQRISVDFTDFSQQQAVSPFPIIFTGACQHFQESGAVR